MTPSKQQSTIYSLALDAINNRARFRILVGAVAGSGKTTTCVELSKLLPTTNHDTFSAYAIHMIAFNSHVSETLKTRVPRTVSVSTFHALGRRALVAAGVIDARAKVNAGKMRSIIYKMMDRSDPDTVQAIKLCDLAKNCAVRPDVATLVALQRHHNFPTEAPESVARTVVKALETSQALLPDHDFGDMCCIPIWLGFRFSVYDFLFVDEAQDLSPVQSEIVAACSDSATSMVIVGDPYQAIYGFRGADAESFENLGARFECAALPLSVSWRCPRLIVEEARRAILEFQHD